MRGNSKKALSGPDDKLLLQTYAAKVGALFSDVFSFEMASAFACSAFVVVAVRSESAATLSLALLLALSTLSRSCSMRAYNRLDTSVATLDTLNEWHLLYRADAAVHHLIIGMCCLAVFVDTTDAVDRIIGLTAAIAYMTGIPGRNFADGPASDIQIGCAGVPICIAMLLAGHDLWLAVVLVVIPFCLGLRGVAARLRKVFEAATIRTYDFGVLVKRFDAALNNMSHGLAMVDAQGLLVVTNERLIDLMRVDPAAAGFGKPMSGIFANLQLAGSQTSDDRFDLDDCANNPPRVPLDFRTSDGAHLEISFRSAPAGGVVMLVQDVSARKLAETRIHQLALFDELTGLANRTHFKEIFEDCLARAGTDTRYAVLFIDLDEFKQVNDTLGHLRGDKLIREVAQRLRNSFSHVTAIARFGGDEFVILCPLPDKSRAEQVSLRIVESLSRPYCIDGHDIVIGASVGISLYPEHDREPDQLLKKADLALYRAKKNGRGSCKLFEPELATEANARRQLETDLHQALRNDEFEVWYQPIYDLKARSFRVCEALVRWRHPQRGLIPPLEFIPVAEDMGLIVELGAIVLERACKDCASWPEDIAVAVNLSALQFRRGDIVQLVTDALALAGLPASRLELELTETAILGDIAFTKATMDLLHARQVRISLDDFGTGYSSLSYLNKLPLSKIKIDRSFLVGLGDEEKVALMLRGLTRLGDELGLVVAVEGVETREQLEFIAGKTTAQEIQGYLFSRPMIGTEARRFLVENMRSAMSGSDVLDAA